MKSIRKLMMASLALTSACVAPVALAQEKWDAVNTYAPSLYHSKVLKQMLDDVEASSGGKLKITFHSNASLFKVNEVKRAVQTGQTQIADVLVGSMANENKIFGVDGVPFLATNFNDSKKLWAASKPVFEDILDKQGLKILFPIGWPPNVLFAKKPIESIKDINGLKWRAYSPPTTRLGNLLGAQGVNVSTADLPQAVATGVVDILVTANPVASQMKLWEHVTHGYAINVFLPMNIVVVNKKAFNALDSATQNSMLQASAKAEKDAWEMAAKEDDIRLADMKNNGLKFSQPSAKLAQELRVIGDVMLKEWLKDTGENGQRIINAYKQ